MSMPDMAIDPVENSQTGPHLGIPKRIGEQAVRVCLPLVPAGKGLQTATCSTFSPAPNTSVSAGTLDGVDESPISSTKIIHACQLPRSPSGPVEAVCGVRRPLVGALERVG